MARRRAEHDAALLFSELAHANRLSTVGQLAASLTHEIRQPLAAIVSSGTAVQNWLAAGEPDPDELRRSVELVVAQAHRADDILTATHMMVRKEAAHREPSNVNTLIREVVALASWKLRAAGVTLRTTFKEQPEPIVHADRVQLQQVFLNLILNAAEAMRDSPTPRILKVAANAHLQHVLITFEDTGHGIAADKLEKIFTPFFTTKQNGMGMGLSICRSIIEAHGGSLTAEPRNGGALFRVVLPGVEHSHA
jgi:C4-dicarboxylate-specific signal transduction histidine kinase